MIMYIIKILLFTGEIVDYNDRVYVILKNQLQTYSA